mgnify:CR=1 FL=1
MFGKGFLWTEDVPLSDWLTLDSLRMEIPDLTFPFDAGGGIERFQHTRCQVREIELSVNESALSSRLKRASEYLNEFHDVRIQFLEDAVHVTVQLRAFGSDTHLSFRASLLPPEPPRSDEVHLSLYDYRFFGPLPYPGRLLAFEWLTGILNTPLFSAPGRGRPFQVGVAGDIASLRPFKLLLVDIFPRHGWKLPNLSGVLLDDVHIQPGELKVRATSQDENWQSEAEPIHQLRSSREGRRALAAYESKDLFAPADEALFGGHIGEALELLSNYREQYGLHPQLAARMLDCLLADPTASHMAEAKSICEDLLEDNPEDLRAHLAVPLMMLISKGDEAALEHYDSLSGVLKRRGDTADWVLSELAAADILESSQPGAAADRLRDVLKATPHSLPVLERLRSLYQRLGQKEDLEDVLKRLTGVHTERERLLDTYLDLARHLMHREGELAEARHYLQKALKIDSENLEALEALGENYTLSDKPMRAVKTFSSAARIAESRNQLPRARQLQFRIARLWESSLGEPEQALLSVRRAISTTESELDAATSLDRPQAIEFAGQLEFAAELCERLSRPEEAIGHWSESVSLLQRLVDADDVPSKAVGNVHSPDPASPLGRLAKAHRHLAALYVERSRASAAESHWKRVLELDPASPDVVAALETYYKEAGQPEKLIELLRNRLRAVGAPARSAELHRKLAEVHEALGAEDEAARHREHAEQFAETDQRSDDSDDVWRHEVETEPVVSSLSSDGSGAQSSDNGGSVGETAEMKADFRRRTADGGDSQPEPDASADSSSGERRPGSHADSGEGGQSDRRKEAHADSKVVDVDDEGARNFGGSEGPASRAETRRIHGPTPSDQKNEEADTEQPEPSDSELDAFRSEYKDLLTGNRDDDGESFEVPSPSDVREDADRGDAPDVDPTLEETTDKSGTTPEPAAETVEAEMPPTPKLRLKRARRDDDPQRLAAVLQDVLDARKRTPAGVDITDDDALAMRHELAELLFFELEDAEAARPHFEALRQGDPDGLGRDVTVLRALESIYEETGNIDGRISVLRARLEDADSEEMVQTYRMLLAHLLWEEKENQDQAKELLEKILREDDEHEGAHRLLADICQSNERWEKAAEHLSVVVDVAGSGLDALEVERELADLLLEKLDRPELAARRYRTVLRDAPGDSRALEGLKTCLEKLEDWEGYLDSLGREFAVLLGRSEPIELDQMYDIDSQISDEATRVSASQIIGDAARLMDKKLENTDAAWKLYGVANQLWPENVGALERRIELDRKLSRDRHLAEDLERFAEGLLDSESRFSALLESAECWEQLDKIDRSAELLERAIDAGENAASTPARLDEAREKLDNLNDGAED